MTPIVGSYLRIRESRQTQESCEASRKRQLLHFPRELHGYVMQTPAPRLCSSPLFLSLFHFCFSLFFHQQHRQSFASRAPTVRKLNERLQLCSHRCNQPRSPRDQGCLFYKFIIGTTLRGIAKLARSCLPNSFPSFMCAAVSFLLITRVLPPYRDSLSNQ